jgi:hypothetical protein
LTNCIKKIKINKSEVDFDLECLEMVSEQLIKDMEINYETNNSDTSQSQSQSSSESESEMDESKVSQNDEELKLKISKLQINDKKPIIIELD